MILEETAQRGHIRDIPLDEGGTDACDALYSVEHTDVGVGEIVDDDDFKAGLLQLHHCVGADIACAAGH